MVMVKKYVFPGWKRKSLNFFTNEWKCKKKGAQKSKEMRINKIIIIFTHFSSPR